ncbi:competence protein CoiA [Paenibacillus sp. GCM10023248]|uniref:competence protein CoiA n=1 Tax=unclassified Paenibacillus TaxID=185978 RepID=UPI002379E43A|nr:competence protein CoiA family protein [Paenibacillus sp. MAHUQ-63]MDD9267861.1 competence protein CoiA family protein [Paenibacillus sp. MAHUQ-63]
MYVAVTESGKKIIPFQFENENEIRLLSEGKKLQCPECGDRVIFHSGPKRMGHFKHWRVRKCENDWEPETEEHIKGKLLMYSYLKEKFPQAQVEFEYKIIETGQRADVICIHPNGERWAFEMQCSEIPGEDWWDRHQLYKSAGIKDFWLLGESVHRTGRTQHEIDPLKHKFVSLPKEIFLKHGAVYFLNVETREVRLLYKMNADYHSHWDTTFIIENVTDDLHQLFSYKHYMVNEELQKKLMAYEEAERKRKEEEERAQQAELKRQGREERDAARQLEIVRNRNKIAVIDAKTILHEKISLADITSMIKREQDKKLFLDLLQKHKLNADNFPGFLRVWTYTGHLIQVPAPVWQLWLYDKYIFNRIETKAWIPTIKDELVKVFNVTYVSKADNIHFSFAIWSYFRAIGSIGFAIQLGERNGNYQEILFDKIPYVEDRTLNRRVAISLSYMGQEDIYNGYDLFSEEVVRQESRVFFQQCEDYKKMLYPEIRKRVQERRHELSITKELKNLIYTLNIHHAQGDIELNEKVRIFLFPLTKISAKSFLFPKNKSYLLTE